MYEMRRWIYPLLALSANSPYYEGIRTGLASTRAHIFGSMPRATLPPYFREFRELEHFYQKLHAAGDVTAPGHLWWFIRPQPPLGTVEVRIFDMPTDPQRLAALAAVVQATLAWYQDRFFEGVPPSDLNPTYLEQNRWKAMRFGLEGKIIEPQTGEILPLHQQLIRLFDLIRPKAHQLGTPAHLDFAEKILTLDNEAAWQVETARACHDDLRELELQIAHRTVAE